MFTLLYKEDRMSKSITLAARVDADLDAELSRLATTTGRTKSWLINEALRSFVANEQQFLAAIEEGKQALKEGRVIDHATVVAAFDRIVAPNASRGSNGPTQPVRIFWASWSGLRREIPPLPPRSGGTFSTA